MAEKQRETADFKMLLFFLAIAVIIETLATQVAAGIVFTILPTSPDHPNWDVFILGLEAGNSLMSGEDFAYLLMWLANDIVMYIPPLIIFGIVFGIVFHRRMDYTRPVTPYLFKYIWVFPLFLAGYALATGSSMLSERIANIISLIFGGGDGLPDVFAEVMPVSNVQMLVMFFTVGIVAPVCEEIIYRHILLKPLRRFGDLQAVVITSVLFGFFHGNLTQFLYTTVIGFILGVTAVRANSVVPAIIIHMLNNIFILLNSYFYDMLDTMPEFAETGLNFIIGATLLLGIAALIYMIKKGYLTVDNHHPHLSPAERRQIIATRPSIIVMTIILVLLTLLGTLL